MRKVLFILGQLADEDAEWLAANGERLEPPPGSELVSEGRPLDSMFIILDGHATVSARGAGVIARLGSGEVVGEISFIDTRPPTATVTAADRCVVFRIAKTVLQRKLDANPAFAARFYRALAVFLSDRLRGTIQRLAVGPDTALDDEVELEGELDEGLLETVHLAGSRFDRMLKRLMETT